MEYIAIDKELYNEIVATVSTASQEIREEYRLYQESVGSEWIENDELSRLLSLSKHQWHLSHEHIIFKSEISSGLINAFSASGDLNPHFAQLY